MIHTSHMSEATEVRYSPVPMRRAPATMTGRAPTRSAKRPSGREEPSIVAAWSP